MDMKAKASLGVISYSVALCGTTSIRILRRRCTPRLCNTRSVAIYSYGHHAAAVSVLTTNVDPSSLDYKENARQMAAAVNRMKSLHEKIEAGGTPKAREKHVARGKMLPREYAPSMRALLRGTNARLRIAV